jgi:hypothetical protein
MKIRIYVAKLKESLSAYARAAYSVPKAEVLGARANFVIATLLRAAPTPLSAPTGLVFHGVGLGVQPLTQCECRGDATGNITFAMHDKAGAWDFVFSPGAALPVTWFSLGHDQKPRDRPVCPEAQLYWFFVGVKRSRGVARCNLVEVKPFDWLSTTSVLSSLPLCVAELRRERALSLQSFAICVPVIPWPEAARAGAGMVSFAAPAGSAAAAYCLSLDLCGKKVCGLFRLVSFTPGSAEPQESFVSASFFLSDLGPLFGSSTRFYSTYQGDNAPEPGLTPAALVDSLRLLPQRLHATLFLNRPPPCTAASAAEKSRMFDSYYARLPSPSTVFVELPLSLAIPRKDGSGTYNHTLASLCVDWPKTISQFHPVSSRSLLERSPHTDVAFSVSATPRPKAVDGWRAAVFSYTNGVAVPHDLLEDLTWACYSLRPLDGDLDRTLGSAVFFVQTSGTLDATHLRSVLRVASLKRKRDPAEPDGNSSPSKRPASDRSSDLSNIDWDRIFDEPDVAPVVSPLRALLRPKVSVAVAPSSPAAMALAREVQGAMAAWADAMDDNPDTE